MIFQPELWILRGVERVYAYPSMNVLGLFGHVDDVVLGKHFGPVSFVTTGATQRLT